MSNHVDFIKNRTIYIITIDVGNSQKIHPFELIPFIEQHLQIQSYMALLQAVYHIGRIAVGMDAYNLQVTGTLYQVYTAKTRINTASFSYV